MMRAAALAAALGCVSADITFSRTIDEVPSYASGTVTIAGSACTGSDQYGSNDCTLAWGTSYDVTYDVSLTQSLPTATISADLKIDGLISFKPSCKACGENCTLTIPVIKKTVSFYPGDCPIPATTLSNTTSVAVPAAPSTLPKTSVKGSVTVADGSGATIGSGTVTASVAKSELAEAAKCNVCPFTPGSVCCNSTIHQVCPGGVECCDCGKETCECPPVPKQTIVELAVATPDLSTLVTALKAGGLVKTLSGNGSFTVFAPTNEAFAALPKEVLAALLKPENKDDLVKVLTYHVAEPETHSNQLKDGEKIIMLEGQNTTAHVSKAGVKINDAKVTSADNDCSNGVVHIVDAVLLYPGFKPPSA